VVFLILLFYLNLTYNLTMRFGNKDSYAGVSNGMDEVVYRLITNY